MISPRALPMHLARRRARAETLDLDQVETSIRQALGRENPALGAFTWLAPCPPAAEARTGSGTGPLAGFSAAVKANICGQGWPNDCGSRILAGYRSPYDSTVIERLRRAGVRFTGVTSMDEFGMGSSGEHAAQGPARNPWRKDLSPGGSSSGSAAAVAAGLAWFALGTDTGGSVRLPAHCCGLVGFKPTYGRISRHGLIAFASSLDTIGILARDLRDTAQIYAVIAGHDPLDATCLAAPVTDPLQALDRPVVGLRVGVPHRWLAADLDPISRREFQRGLEFLAEAGVEVVAADLDDLAEAVPVYTVLSCAEATSNLARYDGSLFGVRAARSEDKADYFGLRDRTRTAGFGTEVKRRIMLGAHVLGARFRRRYYRRAHQARYRIRARFDRLWRGLDAVALPTASGPAFGLGSRLSDPLAMYRTDRFTVPASLAGLPALTLPLGLSEEGLPLSMQLVGPALGEETLLALGGVVEAAEKFRDREEAPWHRPL